MFGLKIIKKRKFEAIINDLVEQKNAEMDAATNQAFYMGRNKGIADVIDFFKSEGKIYTQRATLREIGNVKHCVFLDGLNFRDEFGREVDLQRFYEDNPGGDFDKWVREPRKK